MNFDPSKVDFERYAIALVSAVIILLVGWIVAGWSSSERHGTMFLHAPALLAQEQIADTRIRHAHALARARPLVGGRLVVQSAMRAWW